MPKRSKRVRLFKSTVDKEAKFLTCLLVNGPPPAQHLLNYPDTMDYKQQVMGWWRSCHTSQPAITDKAVHRFYNRYKRWLANELYRQRNADKYMKG